MKFINEYRDEASARKYAQAIAGFTTRSWVIMEICGGQTHTIMKYGLDELLPSCITLLHGPGCPVCVTPIELIEKAIEIASKTDIVFCSFGDMLRVPGTNADLLSVKSKGGDVRVIYSPMDAVRLAAENPKKEVVFFAVGFETTAPANAMAVYEADRLGLDNFSLLVSHVLVPPAIETILSSPNNRVQALLAAGHVCTVMGFMEYEPIAERYGVPVVVTAFEPLDILQGILLAVKQLEEGRAEVENQYRRSVRREGNEGAQQMIKEIFEVRPRKWRGLGEIPNSGLGLREKYARYDAELRFNIADKIIEEPPECQSGLILQGVLKPDACPAFATLCTPEHPLGATMVSSEGACAAYYRYRSRKS